MAGLEGARFGSYELLQRLGGGSMAEVYRSRQLSAFGRDVALKVIHPGYSGDQEFRARFLREAQAIARLSHPHILPLIEAGEEHGMLYLVMPLVREGTLRDLLQRRGALPLQEALPLFTQLCSAVQYAHDEGVIHRDMKPQNILLQRGVHVLLTDFGIARDLLDTRVTLTAGGVGSAEYMAPEQAIGQASAQSDIYSLGVVLYQMLTGAVPFSGTNPLEVLLRRANDPLPDPRLYQPNLPIGIVQALQTALAKDPQQRFERAATFSQAARQTSFASLGNLTTRRMPDAAPAGPPPVPPVIMPPAAGRGWGAQPTNGAAWPNAPTWPGQGSPRLQGGAGGGQPSGYGGFPPGSSRPPPGYAGPPAGRGGQPPGGEGWPDDERHRDGRRSLLIALIAALVLLIVLSSLAYGYFGLGWRPDAGSAGGQPATPSPTATPTPTNTPTPTPTSPPPSPTPTEPSPTPTEPQPSPSPSPAPSPSPEPSPMPSPSPGPPSPAPSPSPTTGP